MFIATDVKHFNSWSCVNRLGGWRGDVGICVHVVEKKS